MCMASEDARVLGEKLPSLYYIYSIFILYLFYVYNPVRSDFLWTFSVGCSARGTNPRISITSAAGRSCSANPPPEPRSTNLRPCRRRRSMPASAMLHSRTVRRTQEQVILTCRGWLPITKEEFHREKMYQTTMSMVRRMLSEGIISKEEYAQMEQIFLENINRWSARYTPDRRWLPAPVEGYMVRVIQNEDNTHRASGGNASAQETSGGLCLCFRGFGQAEPFAFGANQLL